MKKQIISKAAFDALMDGAKILRRNSVDEVKVALSPNQEIIKYFNLANKDFYRKHIYSVSKQFIRNAERLAEKGVETIKPSQWLHCPEAQYDVVLYPLVPGRTIYEVVTEDKSTAVLKAFAQYVASLHDRGIYFRAGHSDNYLQFEDGSFGVIDVDNTRFKMSLRRRAKNLAYIYDHSLRNHHDFYNEYGFDRFVNEYLEGSKLAGWQKKLVKNLVKRKLEKMGHSSAI